MVIKSRHRYTSYTSVSIFTYSYRHIYNESIFFTLQLTVPPPLSSAPGFFFLQGHFSWPLSPPAARRVHFFSLSFIPWLSKVFERPLSHWVLSKEFLLSRNHWFLSEVWTFSRSLWCFPPRRWVSAVQWGNHLQLTASNTGHCSGWSISLWAGHQRSRQLKETQCQLQYSYRQSNHSKKHRTVIMVHQQIQALKLAQTLFSGASLQTNYCAKGKTKTKQMAAIFQMLVMSWPDRVDANTQSGDSAGDHGTYWITLGLVSTLWPLVTLLT